MKVNVTVPPDTFLPTTASLYDPTDVTTAPDDDYLSNIGSAIVPNERTSLLLPSASAYAPSSVYAPTYQPILEDPELDISIADARMHGSTTIQFTFNCINLFIGVGLLAMPYTFKTGGWIFGTGLILLGWFLSRYTLTLLIKAMDWTGAATYSDLGEIALGKWGRWSITSILFGELFSCACAYIVLIGDTLENLVKMTVGQRSTDEPLEWYFTPVGLKSIAFFAVLLPTTLIGSLRGLSVGSIIGIMASFALGVVMTIDGFSKPDAPGSIWESAETTLYPPNLESWLMLPMSLGVVMYNYSGGAVIPNMYRDMKHPEKVHRILDASLVIVTLWFLFMSMLGYCMFGIGTLDDILFNIAGVKEYSRSLTIILLGMIALNPLTKFALMLNPVCVNLELALIRPLFLSPEVSETRRISHSIRPTVTGGDSPEALSSFPEPSPAIFHRQLLDSPGAYTALKYLLRFMIAFGAYLVGVFFPSFNGLLAFIGSFFSFSVSSIFPCWVYLRVFEGRLNWLEVMWIRFLMAFSALMVFVGMFWAPIMQVILDSI